MSLLWITAAARALPVEEGLYWRLHPRTRGFSRADATSQPFHTPEWLYEVDDDGDSEEHRFYAPRSGYSGYRHPRHLMQYVRQRRLDTSDADVIGFRGEHSGYGWDEEDLALPTQHEPEHRMSWEEFMRRMPHTPKPGKGLDLDPEDGRDAFGGEGW